jgi:hypothetical protein
VLSLALAAAWVSGQGQPLVLHYAAEPELTSVSVRWSGHDVPFVWAGEQWLAIVGVDLDSRPGDHAVNVTFRYADGRTRVVSEPVTVRSEQYPTTPPWRTTAASRSETGATRWRARIGGSSRSESPSRVRRDVAPPPGPPAACASATAERCENGRPRT